MAAEPREMSDAETTQATEEQNAPASAAQEHAAAAAGAIHDEDDELLIEEDSGHDVPQATPASSVECLEAVMQIPVSVDVVLGSKKMTVSELTALSKGSLIALDRTIGEPVDLCVNGKPIARGKIVMMEDGSSRFGLTLETIVGSAV